ncbi:29K protein [Pepper ringspot virus]|uniref:29K protein n=1 Tax=Tobacco rattle virus (strain CAM) TaxID=12296 RepID=Q84920_TRVCA|nr:29K protein [Pepper ringspot virus]AAA47083.1 29K protein [Pepper ringspot virus]
MENDKSLVALKKKTFELSNFSRLGSVELFVDQKRKRPKYFHRRRQVVLNNVAGSLTEHKLGAFKVEDVGRIKSYAFLRIVAIQLVVSSHLPRDTPGHLQVDILDTRLTDGRKKNKVLQRFMAKACDNTSLIQYKFDYCVSTSENLADLWHIGTVATGVPVVDGCFPFSVEMSLIWVATDSTTRLNPEELNSTDYLEGDFSDQSQFEEYMSLNQVKAKAIDVKFKGEYVPKLRQDRNLASLEKIPQSIVKAASIKKK